MDQQQTVGGQQAAVGGEGLASQQVHRHRVRREGIDHQHVGRRRRRAFDQQPSIANLDPRAGQAAREEREAARIAGNPDDRRIDFVEDPALARPRVAGQRPGAEPDDADTCVRPEQARHRLHRQADTG